MDFFYSFFYFFSINIGKLMEFISKRTSILSGPTHNDCTKRETPDKYLDFV